MSTHEPGPPEEVPARDPIEELVHTAEDVAEGELLDERDSDDLLGGHPRTPGLIDPIGGELERLTAERDEYIAHLQRTQAEFDNYRKRMLRDQTAHLERATAGLIEQLLPVLDAFELALNSADPISSDAGVDRLRKGVELVYGELLGALEKAGLERIEALGKPFDPEEHEAVMHVEEDGEPGVRDVVRSGYRFKGRVLRPAMVKVAT
jgi:molecular chaperone GrpE